ncbi:MAG: hypothetical protein WAW53_04700 [Candidatus Dormiibacterota bacterium]
MFGRASARDTWVEVRRSSSANEQGLARRKAAFHRRHFLAEAHEWVVALLLLVGSLFLAALAALAVLH